MNNCYLDAEARTILCTFPLVSVHSVTLILSYIRDIFSLISERLATCTSISETIFPSFIRRILSQYSSASSGLCIHMRAHLLSEMIFRICFISIWRLEKSSALSGSSRSRSAEASISVRASMHNCYWPSLNVRKSVSYNPARPTESIALSARCLMLKLYDSSM